MGSATLYILIVVLQHAGPSQLLLMPFFNSEVKKILGTISSNVPLLCARSGSTKGCAWCKGLTGCCNNGANTTLWGKNSGRTGRAFFCRFFDGTEDTCVDPIVADAVLSLLSRELWWYMKSADAKMSESEWHSVSVAGA